MIQTIDILKKIKLFSSLSNRELEELADITSLCPYQEGDTLFFAGDISKSVLILTQGIVSIFKHDGKGNEVVIGYFHRYSLLAEAATLRHTPLPSTAIFHTDGAVLKISLEGFENYLQNHPKLAYEIIQSLLEKIELLQQNIHFNLASSSKEKILNFYSKNPKLNLNLKQYEIASILGMTPETLSRNIASLVNEKKLLQTKTGYTIA
ncbi:MAG: Crp/Fnr family transcriptional regulator [Epsilonproteobacteria bacterium]|nr:Crp/Fnr family transcriptional regulator [Campylobacterota bacterium]